MPRRHSCWPSPNSFTWRKATWQACPPASIVSGTCPCQTKSLNWQKPNWRNESESPGCGRVVPDNQQPGGAESRPRRRRRLRRQHRRLRRRIGPGQSLRGDRPAAELPGRTAAAAMVTQNGLPCAARRRTHPRRMGRSPQMNCLALRCAPIHTPPGRIGGIICRFFRFPLCAIGFYNEATRLLGGGFGPGEGVIAMTEAEWLACKDIYQMLERLVKMQYPDAKPCKWKRGELKKHLFLCASLSRIGNQLPV